MLDRFKAAQEGRFAGFSTALAELRRGRKTSHWIWYVFPQLAGLGQSSMAQEYGLRDLDEAAQYLGDAVLRAHLLEGLLAVQAQLVKGTPLTTLMGSRLDAMKLVSSVTLFEVAATRRSRAEATDEVERIRVAATAILGSAETQGFPRCAFTLSRVQSST